MPQVICSQNTTDTLKLKLEGYGGYPLYFGRFENNENLNYFNYSAGTAISLETKNNIFRIGLDHAVLKYDVLYSNNDNYINRTYSFLNVYFQTLFRIYGEKNKFYIISTALIDNPYNCSVESNLIIQDNTRMFPFLKIGTGLRYQTEFSKRIHFFIDIRTEYLLKYNIEYFNYKDYEPFVRNRTEFIVNIGCGYKINGWLYDLYKKH